MSKFLYSVYEISSTANGHSVETLYTKDESGNVLQTETGPVSNEAGPITKYRASDKTWKWVMLNGEYIGTYYLAG
jgi:hypothetical protein